MATKFKSSALVSVLVIFTILQATYSIKRLAFTPQQKNVILVTSIRCVTPDPSYGKVECILKAVNRTHKYVSGHAVLYKVWKKPVKMRFRIMKRANGGYKPFGVDVTFEGCKYLEGKRNPALDWFYDLSLRHTTINHTCPYSDEIVAYVPVTQIQYPSVFPDGDYRFDIEFGMDGKVRAIVSIFTSLKEL